MIIDKKSNLIHIIRYKTKIYSLNKNISKKKKMKSKTHFDFLIKYDSINIFLIWIFSQRKIIRIRDVIFDENLRYQFNEIDFEQFINEFFITNDTLNIFSNDFTRITKIEFDNEKKLWNLTFIDFITTRDDIFEKTFEKMTNDVEHDYLLSFVSTSSKNENISNDFDIVSKTSISSSSSSTFAFEKKNITSFRTINWENEKIETLKKKQKSMNLIFCSSKLLVLESRIRIENSIISLL